MRAPFVQWFDTHSGAILRPMRHITLELRRLVRQAVTGELCEGSRRRILSHCLGGIAGARQI